MWISFSKQVSKYLFLQVVLEGGQNLIFLDLAVAKSLQSTRMVTDDADADDV